MAWLKSVIGLDHRDSVFARKAFISKREGEAPAEPHVAENGTAQRQLLPRLWRSCSFEAVCLQEIAMPSLRAQRERVISVHNRARPFSETRSDFVTKSKIDIPTSSNETELEQFVHVDLRRVGPKRGARC